MKSLQWYNFPKQYRWTFFQSTAMWQEPSSRILESTAIATSFSIQPPVFWILKNSISQLPMPLLPLRCCESSSFLYIYIQEDLGRQGPCISQLLLCYRIPPNWHVCGSLAASLLHRSQLRAQTKGAMTVQGTFFSSQGQKHKWVTAIL